MNYPPIPQRKNCNCEDPCISTDDVYYAGPNLPNSGVNTNDVLTIVIEKLDAIYAVPTLQRVTEMGNLTTLPIIADSFVKIGGDGTNLLLDNGTVLPIGDLPASVTETSQLINNGQDGINPFITLQDIPAPIIPSLQEVTDQGNTTNNPITAERFIKAQGLVTEFLMADGSVSTATPFNPADYDLDEFTNTGIDPFAHVSDIPAPLGYTPVNKAGDTMLGSLILHADPSVALQAATKQYVDNIAGGITFRSPVFTATTGNLNATYNNGTSGVGATLTSNVNGVIAIDQESPGVLERVLVWKQTNAIQNGIYEVTNIGSISTPFILTRTADADNTPAGELAFGDYTFVLSGATNGGRGFICNTSTTIVIGVTPISFVQFNTAQVTTPGYGLQDGVSPGIIEINPLETQEKITLTTNGGSGAATLDPLTNILNIPQYSGNPGTVTSITATSPLTGGTITSSGSIGIPAATTSVSGYLTSNDWNTFNSKQAALVSGVNIRTVGGLSLLTNGDIPLIYPVIETTSGHTLTNADNGGIIIFKTTAAQTLNIPLGLANGFECTFVTLSGVVLTIPAVSGITLNNATNPTGSNIMLPQLSFTLKRMLAANTYIATGNI